jgi:hypothetical protein
MRVTDGRGASQAKEHRDKSRLAQAAGEGGRNLKSAAGSQQDHGWP